MSKRERKTKQILLAVFCAISIQAWSAPPVWSAQPAPLAGVSTQKEQDAPIDKKTQNTAGDEESAVESATPTVGGYSINLLGAAPRTGATGAVGDISVAGGAMTGVTSINGAYLKVDSSDKESNMIFSNVPAAGTLKNVTSFGLNGSVSGEGASAFGAKAQVNGDFSSAIGAQALANSYCATAIGALAKAVYSRSTALGHDASAAADNAMALGADTQVDHTNSVALGQGSKTSAANQVAFGDLTSSGNASSYRSLAGIKDIAMTGALSGVTALNGIRIDISRNLTDAGTYNGVTIGSGGINGATITSTSFNNVNIAALKATVDDNLGGISRTKIDSSGGEAADNFKTTVEGSTSFTTAGITTNSITASGKVTAGEFVEGSTKLSDKYAGKSAFDTLNATVTTAGTGLVAKTTALETTVGDAASGLVKDVADNTAGIASKANADASGLTDPNKAAWKTALGVDTLATTVAGKANKATTLAGYGITDAYTKAEANTELAKKVDVETYTSRVTALESADAALSGRADTLESKATALETKTNKLSADGTTLTGMTDITSTSATMGGVTFAAGGVVTNVASINGMGIAVSGTTAKTLKVSGTVDATTLKQGGKGIYTAEEIDAKFGTSGGDVSALTGRVTTAEGKITTLEDNTDGITVDGGTTKLDNGFKVGTTAYGMDNTGALTANSINGAIITQETFNGAAISSSTFNGVDVEALKNTVDDLSNTGGTTTANTKGISRTKINPSGGEGADNFETTVEGSSSFTTAGMKTTNLEAATAAIGGVNFGGNGALTGVASINGISFDGGKVGGVSLSGGKVDGISISGLNNRVTALENSSGGGGGGTGGGGANTGGISRPNGDKTIIEGNTSIGAEGIETNDLTASGSITVAKGEVNQTVINENGIHVCKNSSVVNDTDGFITDKGLYIGVSSSSDLGSAKFSVAPSGNLSSTAGNYGFSNTSTGGAKFTDTGSKAHGGGTVMDTTIKGNTVETGRIDTDELYVGGNKVVISGSTVQPGTHIDNHLEGNDASGNAVTNDFTTSALNGTTESAEKVSEDGKNTIKTTNNTSATGTSNTTTKTDVDSSDNKTVQQSQLTTDENGMKLNTSNTVTDKEGNKTSSSSGATTMTGDSLSVSKTTTTKDAEGNEVTKTSSTTVGSGEVTLNREDGSSIRVGDAIEGLQSDVQELGGRINEMGVEIKEVGALSAALAGLHPQPQNANTKADFAMAMGSYEGKQALAVGAFYKPDKRIMLSMGASTTSSKHMMNMGISIALDRMPEAERAENEGGKVDSETLNKVLERLANLESENKKLASAYAELKEKYAEEKEVE